MNKIAAYLNEHLLGDVSSSKAMRRRFSRDGSVLTITPEIVVFPRVTNDIRKAARFAWQLAEKGHQISLTARGAGTDTTGGAIGKGMVINTSRYLNDVIHIALKERLAHVQPGTSIQQLQTVLKWNGLTIPNAPASGTVGGALAFGALGSNGAIGDIVEKLEVVLANGDLIETSRLSRRDVSKKLGLQTFEGEIYRKLEGLLEDNEELIAKIAQDPTRDNAGYRSIGRVRRKDGSIDLTPLFLGSQGTLGIISEVVLKTEFFNADRRDGAIVTAKDFATARDLADGLRDLQPAILEIYDGELFRRASAEGAKFNLLGDVSQVGAVVFAEFCDFNHHIRHGKVKKMRKAVEKLGLGMIDSSEHAAEDFFALTGVTQSLELLAQDDKSALPIIDGAFVPRERQEEFFRQLTELTDKHHLELPLKVNVLTGTIYGYPTLKLDVVSDKQKLFRLMNDYAELVDKADGAFVSDGAEGRLKANAAWAVFGEQEAALYEQIRQIFDPFGTLNEGVKQKNDVRTLVAGLRSSYDATDFVA